MATNSSLPTPSASSASSLVKDQSGANFTTANVARIIKVDDSTGCTLTNASIKGLTPAEFEALSNKEIDLARVIASSAEAKVLGVRQRGLVDLLNSSITNIKPLINKVNVAEQSIILPYIQRRQRSILNSGYFAVEAGVAATGASPIDSNSGYSLAPQDWEVTVNLGASDWATPIDHIERYFLTGGFVVCNWWDSGAGKEPIEVQFQIIGAADASAGNIQKAKVTLRPVGKQISATYANQATWNGTTPASATQVALAAQYKPTYGIVQTIANNVNDFEAWCQNQPTDLSVKIIVNWLQTTRESRTIDQSYKETLQKIMNGDVNSYLKSMVYTPLSEQNKIAAQASQDQWLRSTWFNQPISDKQTPETYMNLPAVTDPEDSSCTLEYKSNALGIKALLAESNRVKSKSGGVYTLEDLQSDIYYLKRNREQDGSSISVVDVMTDRFTYNKLFEVFNKYYQGRYGWGLDRNAQINQQITHNGILLFNYSMFDLPEVGCQLAVFHDPYFDDMINHGAQMFNGDGFAGADGDKAIKDDGSRSTQPVFGTGNASKSAEYSKSMRSMWFIDWSDVKIGIAGTNSVTRKWPKPEVMESYKCRMAHKETEYSLRSTKWTTMMDVPARHLIVENFDVAAATNSWSTYIT
jgi:hypothetical protein